MPDEPAITPQHPTSAVPAAGKPPKGSAQTAPANPRWPTQASTQGTTNMPPNAGSRAEHTRRTPTDRAKL
jgi:hypothetical protein